LSEINNTCPLGFFSKIKFLIFSFIALCFLSLPAWAQLGNRPNQVGNTLMNQRDPFADTTGLAQDSASKKKAVEWDEEPAIISYKYLNSEVKHYYDSSILFFHRSGINQNIDYQDLGNFGAPANKRIFDLQSEPGLRLGYNLWDRYKIGLDSVHFVHTTRPYTSLSFSLGPKEMQWVDFFHTQNINPNWNFAFRVANNTSQGFYRIQKATGVNAFLSTDYKSDNERHKMKIALIANSAKNDENGGIVSDSFLNDNAFSNRTLIPTNINANSYTISPVNNRHNNFQFYIENSYAWGIKDTTYNEDSTQASYHFTPRFSLKHRFNLERNRHRYTDGLLDANRYAFYQPIRDSILRFPSGADTIRIWETLTTLDNRFSINTFIGKELQLVQLEAGIGIRLDWYRHNVNGPNDADKNYLSNYVFGQLHKDAIEENQWSYLAALQFFYSGPAIGNLKLEGNISKEFKQVGAFNLGAKQLVMAPTFQQEWLQSKYFVINNEFSNTSNTKLYGNLNIKALKLDVTLSNQLINNYIYLDESLNYRQHEAVFSVLQLAGRKLFEFGNFNLDNEVVWQQLAGDAPLNLPSLLLRHQLTFKVPLFKGKLLTYLGLEGQYHTPYKADGYNPVFNQFYYQDNITIDNMPSLAMFFNFKVKRLRAYVAGEQLQQYLFNKTNINAPGYPAANPHIRFGFNWVMMN
jgi:hypothetical protein